MKQTDWPITNNYFVFYGLEPVYHIDVALLKKSYLDKSRQFHPDFFGEDLEAQSRAIEVTAFNNKAFKILNQPLERIKYLIQINEESDEEIGHLPQDFLMEMLDLNEQIDELEFSKNSSTKKDAIALEIEANLKSLTILLIELANQSNWKTAKAELLKVNYLERLLARLVNANNDENQLN